MKDLIKHIDEIGRNKVGMVTGHRPPALFPNLDDADNAYSRENFEWLVAFALHALVKLTARHQIELWLTGGALGWDLAWARACQLEQVPYAMCLPHRNHGSNWVSFQDTLEYLCADAEFVHLVTDASYSARLMQVRNEFMVNNSRLYVALWNGNQFGGTYNCVRYIQSVAARLKGDGEDFRFYSLWNSWIKIQQEATK